MKEVETLRAVVGNYEKDKTALGQSKARLLQSDKHLKHLEWENEVCLTLTLKGNGGVYALWHTNWHL